MKFPHKPQLTLDERVLDRLSSLPYLGFEAFAMELLECLGYRSFESTGRKTKRGRKDKGGVDFFASVDTAIASQRVLIQIKQYRLQRHFIDELRGAMPEYNATQAIIISTRPAGRTARLVAGRFGARPVEIIDGPDLIRLMFQYRIGVRLARSLKVGKSVFEIDEAYFHGLQELGKAAGKAGSSKQQQMLFHPILSTYRYMRSFVDQDLAELIVQAVAAGWVAFGVVWLVSFLLKHLFHF